MEQARPATEDDLDVLAELWSSAVAELDGQRGGYLLAGSLIRPALPEWLAEGLVAADRLFVLGTIDDVPVGLASVVVDTERRERIASVELIYVEPGARQVGVAESMLGVVQDWSAGQACVGVDAPALPGNRPAKSFFEDHGFTARLLIMHRPAAPTGDTGTEPPV